MEKRKEELTEEERINELMALIMQHAEEEGVTYRDGEPEKGRIFLKSQGTVVAEVIEPVSVEDFLQDTVPQSEESFRDTKSSDGQLKFEMNINQNVSHSLHPTTYKVYLTEEETILMDHANKMAMKKYGELFDEIVNEIYREEHLHKTDNNNKLQFKLSASDKQNQTYSVSRNSGLSLGAA